ncbi:MAG: hypothetical protein KGJ93_05145 [Patescibacteria group bacterium]|nr:hypothetical protein [Patescibacteria group bacterium]
MIEDDSKFEQVEQHRQQQVLAREEAAHFIGSCLTDISRLGANDSEPSELLRLQAELLRGEISPQVARAKAAEIVARKNPYH